MIGDKKVLAVVPARGGSKGVKLKNIREIGGIPLIAMVGNVIREVPEIDRAIVSTDHDQIAEIAMKSGLDCPFFRPEELSGDRIADIDVLLHVLREIESIDKVLYDIIVMLQPTSPSRKVKHVSDAINKLIDSDADSVWSVSETDSKAHPLKQLVINGENLDYYDSEGAKVIARQQLKPVYHRNGIVYAITRDCIVNKKSIKGENCVPLVIDGYVSNIDTELDIAFAEFLLKWEDKK